MFLFCTPDNFNDFLSNTTKFVLFSLISPTCLNCSQSNGSWKYKHMICTNEVCATAWMPVIGVPRSTSYKYQKMHKGKFLIDCQTLIANMRLLKAMSKVNKNADMSIVIKNLYSP